MRICLVVLQPRDEGGSKASADEFFDHALRWFGYSGLPIKSEWEKGEKLSDLIKKQRTLLVIDGLEPLQYPPGVLQGRLKDQGLQSLLCELAAQNKGLCLITTRLPIADVEDFKATVQDIPLEHLSDEAGAQVLAAMGVKGTEEELKQASAEFKGHALALTLLGSYLSAVHNGEIRKRDLIAKLTADEEKGGHAKRVMASYVKWLAGKPELNVLFLMGLFDRPATGGAVAALRAKPPINNFTDAIYKLREDQWQFSVKHLRDLRLLDERDERNPDTLDCHPFVREYFGDRLRHKHPVAWKKAHSRLYEHFKTQAPELPNTLDEMVPLFSAVAHGCAAGRHQDAMDKVYWTRISRGQIFFSTMKLGAFGSDLACLSHFFEAPWHTPAVGLSEGHKAAVLSWAGFRLRALGRLTEAIEPMQAGLKMRIAINDWKNASIGSENLSELLLAMGEVGKAVEYAEKGVQYSDNSEESAEKRDNRATLGDALHQAGRIDEAKKHLLDAEEIQKKDQPEYYWLYSFRGFRYCNLLLGRGQYQEVLERAEQTLKWSEKYFAPLDIALNKLSLGRGHLLKTLNNNSSDYLEAERYLNGAVEGLRKASAQEFVTRGLLARAELYRIKKAFTKAHHDLYEAMTIATRGGMKLHEADCHLEYARLYLARGDKEKAIEHLSTAKKMIDEMGYHRRDVEVLLVNASISLTDVDKATAQAHLSAAKLIIDEKGLHGCYWEVKELEAMLEKLS